MTNFEKFISKLTPKKLSQIMALGGKCPPIPEEDCESMSDCITCYKKWFSQEAEDP